MSDTLVRVIACSALVIACAAFVMAIFARRMAFGTSYLRKLAEYDGPMPKAQRSVLPISSLKKTPLANGTMTTADLDGTPHFELVKPGEIATITVRPQWAAFKADRFVIGGGHPERWLVHDIKVGNRSQLQMGGSCPSAIPGDAFGSDPDKAIELGFETCQTAMDFAIAVSYVGPEAAGEPFFATAVGLAAV